MSNLQNLMSEQDEVLAKIRDIEANCEGVENENNAKRISQLNLKYAQISASKSELASKLSVLNKELSSINEEIRKLSGKGVERLLEAIKGQRWFFIKNKPNVLFDKNTGILWANLDYYPYETQRISTIDLFDFDGIEGFRLPKVTELWDMIEDKTFPFKEGQYWKIKNTYYWSVSNNCYKDLNYSGYSVNGNSIRNILPCSSILVDNTEYVNNISSNNHVYTETERLQFTLNIFVENKLLPIYKNDEISKLHKEIYFEKPILIERLAQIQKDIENLQTEVLLSSTFDYNTILSKYNTEEIDTSIIKYYKAVQSYINELLQKVESFEKAKEDIVNQYKIYTDKLLIPYEVNKNLSTEENNLLKNRKNFLKNKIDLTMNDARQRLLLVKNQADDIEQRIDQINKSLSSMSLLSTLESENRASFSFIAENSANIVKKSLLKIEHIEKHELLISNIIELELIWQSSYKTLKIEGLKNLEKSYAKEKIDQETLINYYNQWCNSRFILEKLFTNIIKISIEKSISTSIELNNEPRYIVNEILNILGSYKEDIDNFYNKGIIKNKTEESIQNDLSKINETFKLKVEDIMSNIDDQQTKILLRSVII